MEIIISVLMIMLIVAQLFLCAKLIKSKAPDGKILLTVNLAVIALWTPLCIVMFIFNLLGLKIAFYALSAIYMIFTMWYTNAMRR